MTTTREAVLSIVAAKGGSTAGVGPLDRDALDRLLDTMAGSDVHTSVGALDSDVVATMAQYVGGGGGVDVGNVLNLARLDTTPVVGEELDDDIVLISSVSIADSVICASNNGQALSVAAGCTVNTTPTFATASPSAYIVAFDADYFITSVTEFAGTIAVSGEADAYEYTFVVPEVEGDNVVLAIVASIA